jgi:mannose-6-phosphate isomerase-like protein (cupin superfamily)
MRTKTLLWALAFSTWLLVAGFASAAEKAAQAPPTPKLKHHFSLAGKGETHVDGDTVGEVDVSAADSGGRYTLLDERWQPTFSVKPHYHATHSETFYIVSGKVEWTVGGEAHVMSAGDAVHIPAGTVHAVRVVGNEVLHTLMIYEPGGYEDHLRRQESYTPEQLNDPEVIALLRELNDFHPVKTK